MIRSITAAIAALFLMVSVPSMSVAKGGGPGTENARVEAELVPCCGNPEPEAKGEARRKTQSKSGVVKSDTFRAKVEIPLPSVGLGITDPTTADIRLALSRAGLGDYAECFLEFDDDDQAMSDGDTEEAEFGLKIRLVMKKGTPVLRSMKGQCIIAQTGQPGVPDVQAGDVATVNSVDSSAIRTPFLEGTFVQH